MSKNLKISISLKESSWKSTNNSLKWTETFSITTPLKKMVSLTKLFSKTYVNSSKTGMKIFNNLSNPKRNVFKVGAHGQDLISNSLKLTLNYKSGKNLPKSKKSKEKEKMENLPMLSSMKSETNNLKITWFKNFPISLVTSNSLSTWTKLN